MKKTTLAAFLCLSSLSIPAMAFNLSNYALTGVGFEVENGSVRGAATYVCPYQGEEVPPTYARIVVEKKGSNNERPGIMWVSMVTQSGIPAMDEAVATGKIPRNQSFTNSTRIYFVDQGGRLVEFDGTTTPPPAVVDREVLRDAYEVTIPLRANEDGELRGIYVGYGLANEKMLQNYESRKKGIEKSDKIAAERGLNPNRPPPEMIMESHMYTMIQREMMDNLRMIKVGQLTHTKCLELRGGSYGGY